MSDQLTNHPTPPAPAISQFEFGNHHVRVVMIEGEPWWVAKDVCAALAIAKHRDALSRLDQDERGSVVVDTLGGKQELTAINEPGLYTLILRSRKAEAKAFKRWVTHEVLPQIRKTGRYAVETHPPMALDPMELIRAAEAACKKIGLGPQAGKAIAREVGANVGIPAALLPVLAPAPPKTQIPFFEPDKKEIGAKIRERRIELGIKQCELAQRAFPKSGKDAAQSIVSRMERGESLSRRNLEAVNRILGDGYMTAPKLTQQLDVPLSMIRRFPSVPTVFELGVYFDEHGKTGKDKLRPAHHLAREVFEVWAEEIV